MWARNSIAGRDMVEIYVTIPRQKSQRLLPLVGVEMLIAQLYHLHEELKGVGNGSRILDWIVLASGEYFHLIAHVSFSLSSSNPLIL